MGIVISVVVSDSIVARFVIHDMYDFFFADKLFLCPFADELLGRFFCNFDVGDTFHAFRENTLNGRYMLMVHGLVPYNLYDFFTQNY